MAKHGKSAKTGNKSGMRGYKGSATGATVSVAVKAGAPSSGDGFDANSRARKFDMTNKSGGKSMDY